MPVAGIAAAPADEGDEPAPVDRPGECLANPDIVERRPRRVEAVVVERQRPRSRGAAARASGRSRSTSRRRRRSSAGRRRRPRTPRPGCGRRCRGRARRSRSPAARPSSGRSPSRVVDVVARRPTGRSRRCRRSRPASAPPAPSSMPGGTTANVGLGDDRQEVGRGPDQADLDIAAPSAVSPTDAGSLRRRRGRTRARRRHRAMRRRAATAGRVDDPQPAPDDVVRGERRAVARTSRPGGDGTRPGAPPSRRSQEAASAGRTWSCGVERGEALEQLGGDGRAADVALGGGIERRRRRR